MLVVLGGFKYSASKKNSAAANIQTGKVIRQDIKETVLTTGQVVSDVDLNLSFQSSGIVGSIKVKEGDHVKAGQILATLSQTTLAASLTSALGTLAQAEANYQKVLAGASNEQINVAEKAVAAAQTTLDNAVLSANVTKQQQQVLVNNAYSAMLNSTPALVGGPANSSGSAPTVSGTYVGTASGQYRITLISSGSIGYTVAGLGQGSGTIPTNASTLVSIGNGLYLQFPVATYHPDDYWTIDIPNTKASTYLTNYNAYQSALQTQQAALAAAEASVNSAKTSLAQAQASLEQQKAAARPADIAVARAQILSAQGQVASAQAALSNTVIKAPSDGTITQVDIKVGEQATMAKEVMKLQSVGLLHAEANVSEANVASLALGQKVDYTFDALGPDRHFTGTITTINPASILVSGVVDYKITADLENIPEIKPGMTANMTILVAQKAGVLTVPSSAVINKDSKHYVRVIDNTQTKTYHEVEVQTGLEADGGVIEITAGLTENQDIVTFLK